MSGPEAMNEFERDLTRAMRRVNAPETLAQFLMLAAKAEQQRVLPRKERANPRILAFAKPRGGAFGWLSGSLGWSLSGALAAALVAGVFVTEQAHVRHEREQAAVVQQQFDAAMRVTDRALNLTQAQLQRAGLKLGN
jgi:hypothetical protein